MSVYRTIGPLVLIFDPKKIVGKAVLMCTHNLCFEHLLKIFNFYNLRKSVYYMGMFS